jgi:Ca-activated chloride channel family protein
MKRPVFACGIAFTFLFFALAWVAEFSVAAQSGRRAQPSPTPTPRASTDQRPESRPPLNQAPQTPVAPDESGVIKIDTSLVSIPLTALDRTGRYVPFMKKEDFRVFEDGVEQEIADFTPVTVPLHVVLLLDTSRSTVFKLEDIQAAAVAFVEQLRADDQVMVVSFDEKVYVDSEFTSNRAQLRRAIFRTRTGGGTKLYEAVDLVVSERLNQVEGRKAIVLFTDGVDTMSKGVTARDTVDQVEESDVIVFPIQYNTEQGAYGTWGGGNRNPNGMPPITLPQPRRPGRRWPLQQPLQQWTPQFPGGGQWPPRGSRGGGGGSARATEYLAQLADRSGGRVYQAETLGNVQQAFTNIAEELRHQYALSYYPSNTKEDGTFRRVRVQSKTAGVVIRAREGYRAKGTPSGTDGKERPLLRPRQLAESGQ